MPRIAEPKPLNLTVILNGKVSKQNKENEYFYVDSRLEVECEAERSETRSLIWDAACRELDSADRGRAVDCENSLGFSPAEVLFYSIIFMNSVKQILLQVSAVCQFLENSSSESF